MREPANGVSNNHRLRVAMIEPLGGHSGMHYYDFGLCRGLQAAGCRVSLYTCDETANPSIPGLRFFPVYRHIFGPGSRWLQAIRYIAGTLSAAKKAANSGEVICHLQVFNSLFRDLVVILTAKLFGRKLILTVHDVDHLAGPQTSIKRKVTGWTYRLAERLIVHNRVSMIELEGTGVPSSSIHVIPHGNYLDSMRPLPPQEEARRSLGIKESARVVLFFGQIKDVKGLDVLIEAMPAIASEVPDVVFLIVGRPWRIDFSIYDALIEKLNMRGRCRLHIGYVPDEEVAKYYSASDVVVLPYRRIYQSGVLIMAMSSRRPVVVSDLPGMTEIVTDGQTGYVFTRGSKDALAEQLVRALKDDQGRQQVAERGFDYIRVHHDWGLIGKKTADVYRMALSRGVPLEESECIQGTK